MSALHVPRNLFFLSLVGLYRRLNLNLMTVGGLFAHIVGRCQSTWTRSRPHSRDEASFEHLTLNDWYRMFIFTSSQEYFMRERNTLSAALTHERLFLCCLFKSLRVMSSGSDLITSINSLQVWQELWSDFSSKGKFGSAPRPTQMLRSVDRRCSSCLHLHVVPVVTYSCSVLMSTRTHLIIMVFSSCVSTSHGDLKYSDEELWSLSVSDDCVWGQQLIEPVNSLQR